MKSICCSTYRALDCLASMEQQAAEQMHMTVTHKCF